MNVRHQPAPRTAAEAAAAVQQSLHLHFPDVDQRRTCQVMLHHLLAGNADRAAHWAAQISPSLLGDLGPGWRRWQQPTIQADGPWLVLNYQTPDEDDLPLTVLRALAGAGLHAARLQLTAPHAPAALELHLLEGRKVHRDAWLASVPTLPGRSLSDARPAAPQAEPRTDRPTPASTPAAEVEADEARDATDDAEAAAMAYVLSNRGGPRPARDSVWARFTAAFR